MTLTDIWWYWPLYYFTGRTPANLLTCLWSTLSETTLNLLTQMLLSSGPTLMKMAREERIKCRRVSRPCLTLHHSTTTTSRNGIKSSPNTSKRETTLRDSLQGPPKWHAWQEIQMSKSVMILSPKLAEKAKRLVWALTQMMPTGHLCSIKFLRGESLDNQQTLLAWLTLTTPETVANISIWYQLEMISGSQIRLSWTSRWSWERTRTLLSTTLTDLGASRRSSSSVQGDNGKFAKKTQAWSTLSIKRSLMMFLPRRMPTSSCINLTRMASTSLLCGSAVSES